MTTAVDLRNDFMFDISNGVLAAVRNAYSWMGDVDSYKLSQWCQYESGADRMMSYIESRGGKFDSVMFWGVQLLLLEYFTQKITHEQVDNMVAFAAKHGEPFNEKAFRKIVDVYDGRPPIVIKAVKEGTLVPTKNVLLTIETSVSDSDIFWIVSYFETKLLRLWSPTTVATISFFAREVIMKGLNETCDNPLAEIWHRLNDFGSRGTPEMSASAFAGSGHLLSFMGTDNIPAVLATMIAYKSDMPGHSIPASEHSTITSWGLSREDEALLNMVAKYAKPGSLFACVSDSNDIVNAVNNIWGTQLKQKIIESGATLVVRPDSNDPVMMPVWCVQQLAKSYGYTTNKKGYKVLNNVRVIQGDGLGIEQIDQIVQELIKRKFSVENVAFGMGAGLLQKNDRDTQQFAMKCCAIRINGVWRKVYKDPVKLTFSVADNDEIVATEESSPSFKKSKGGLLTLVTNGKDYETIQLDELAVYEDCGWTEALFEIYRDGFLTSVTTLDEARNVAFSNEEVVYAEVA